MDLFWENPGWQQEDRHLRALAEAPFRRPFPRTALGPGLWIVRGPRQVGKSSWLKTLLSHAVDPKDAFYVSCEHLQDHQDLAALLGKISANRSLILLDEISFVRDWARAIKHLMDRGYRGTLVVTGSHAVDLRRGGEQMPGRFFGGGELLLLPMDFNEYEQARADAHWPVISRVEALERYFRCGGFPAAVIEAGPDGNDTPIARDTYRRWLGGDASRLGKREHYLRDVLGQLALTQGAPISLQTLAKRTQFGSHHTALEYVELLEDCFALRTLFCLEPNHFGFQYKKDKKFYFCDPIIYHIALEWSGLRATHHREAVLAEMTAAEAILRRAGERHLRVGFMSNAKGEIDFISPDQFAIEVKWSMSDHNLSRLFKEVSIAEKLVWSQHNMLTELPLALADIQPRLNMR